MAGDVIEGLKSCELFALLSQAELEEVTSALATICTEGVCEVCEYETGDFIFEQGEHSARFYIIVEGQVLLKRSVNIGDRIADWPLALLGKGRVMGWSSLLHGPRYLTASAICQKPSRVIAADGAVLRSVLEENPVIGLKVMSRLAWMLGERLRQTYNKLESHL